MAQDLTQKKTNFISNCAIKSSVLLQAYLDLRSLRLEYTSENYSSSLVQADFIGTNAHMTPTIISNLMTTYDQIDLLINSTSVLVGSTGNLQRLYDVKP